MTKKKEFDTAMKKFQIFMYEVQPMNGQNLKNWLIKKWLHWIKLLKSHPLMVMIATIFACILKAS